MVFRPIGVHIERQANNANMSRQELVIIAAINSARM